MKKTATHCAAGEKAALQQAQADRERRHQQVAQALESEVGLLTRQLEQLARERVALDSRLKELSTQASHKTSQLSQELASRERLVENLAAQLRLDPVAFAGLPEGLAVAAAA